MAKTQGQRMQPVGLFSESVSLSLSQSEFRIDSDPDTDSDSENSMGDTCDSAATAPPEQRGDQALSCL